MIKGLVGAALVVWALWAGIGTRESNRAQLFQGPVGTLVSVLVILAGTSLIIWGFF